MGGFPRDTGVKVDPKIEAFTNYRDNMHKNFRMNGPTIFKSLIFAVVIPAFLYLKIKQGSVCRRLDITLFFLLEVYYKVQCTFS